MSIQKQCEQCATLQEQLRIANLNNDKLKELIDAKNAMLDLARMAMKGEGHEPPTATKQGQGRSDPRAEYSNRGADRAERDQLKALVELLMKEHEAFNPFAVKVEKT